MDMTGHTPTTASMHYSIQLEATENGVMGRLDCRIMPAKQAVINVYKSSTIISKVLGSQDPCLT